MELSKKLFSFIILSSVLLSGKSFANLPNASRIPIDHCYHWLDERTSGFLTYKYNEAKRTGGEFSFYTTGANGAMAGAGIYCAKTLIESYTYGDRVVRIDFVDDIVATDDSARQVCGTNGNFYANQADCAKQPVDVYLYNTTNEWYVIKNPKAIKSWTANSPELIKDLLAIKPFADSTAASHIDMTLMLMQNEAARISQKTYINPSARLDLLDILRDQKKTQQIPVLSLIEMIAAAPTKKISDSRKESLYTTHLLRALKDQVLAYSDYSSLLGKFSDVRDRFKTLIGEIDFKSLSEYNTVVLIAEIDKLDVNLSTDKIRALWTALWGSKTSYESLLTLNLKKDGAVLKQFDAFIPPNFEVDDVQDSNIGYLLGLLDNYVPTKGNSYQDLSEKLFAKLLRGTHYYVADSVYDKMKNPAMSKEKALVSVFQDLVRKPESKLDLLAVSALFDRIKDQLSADQTQILETQIAALPIKVSPKLSFIMLEEYKAGKLKVPATVSRSEFLNRLVERSIAERSLGASTTNTYRMILSGYYSVFVADLAKANSDPAKAKIMKQASAYFANLANELENDQMWAYAYAAWQNSQYFGNGMTYTYHPIENAFGNYLKGKKAFDQEFSNLVVHGMDSGVLLYLVSVLGHGSKSEATKAELLLTKILQNYVSSSFQQKIKTKTFQLVDNEKKIWFNFLTNKELAPSGTIRSDLCTYNGSIHNSAEVLSQKFPALWAQVESVKNQIYADCKK
jgi:hypothetical protein